MESQFHSTEHIPDKKQSAPGPVHRATKILLCLSTNANTIKEISQRCNYSPATVHRLLKMLIELAWVRREPSTHKYYLGPLISELTKNLVSPHRFLIMCALDDMLRLSSITGETVSLGIMLDLRYVTLHEIPSRHDVDYKESASTFDLPSRGATGKVLLSQLNNQEIKNSLKMASKRVPTQARINCDSLIEEIENIRTEKYGISYGEIIPGRLCISAPIKKHVCPAALSVIGPQNRLSVIKDEVIRELILCSKRISDSNAA